MRLPVRVLVLSLSFAAALPLGAQSAAPVDPPRDSSVVVLPTEPASTGAVDRTPVAGASLTGLRAGVHSQETVRPNDASAIAQAGRQNMGQSQAMMIVGVAALVAGAVIGDTPGTIIMVGGAVIGLMGLYDYLK